MTLCTLVAGAGLILVVRPLMVRAQATGNILMAAEKSYIHFLTEHIIGMKAVKYRGCAGTRACERSDACTATAKPLDTHGAHPFHQRKFVSAL